MSEATTNPSGVLRPFEAPEREPLPPIEPPAIAPESTLPRPEPEATAPAETTTDEAPEADDPFSPWAPAGEPDPETEFPIDDRRPPAETADGAGATAAPSLWSAFGSGNGGSTGPAEAVEVASDDDADVEAIEVEELPTARTEIDDDLEGDVESQVEGEDAAAVEHDEAETIDEQIGVDDELSAEDEVGLDEIGAHDEASADDEVGEDDDVDVADHPDVEDHVGVTEADDAHLEADERALRSEPLDERDPDAEVDEFALLSEPAEDADADVDDDADRFWAAPAEEDEPEDTAVEAAPAATVTLPRQAFLIGLGVVGVALIALFALWQSAGGDTTTVVADGAPTPSVDDAPAVDEAPLPSLDPSDPDVDPTAVAEFERELTEARAEAAALQAEIDLLEARPAAGLPGDRLRRIVVSADAKFISAVDNSVAVVGAFGGLSLIDPVEDRVVATAPIGESATRVMRTSTAVWVTDYADSRVVRIDPENGQVVAAFPFPGPDGIVKDGNSLVIASFDDGIVARVDPSSGEILAEVAVGGSPTALVSHPEHGLWAAVFDTGEIVKIDQDDFGVVDRVVVGAGPVGLTADDTHLFVTNNDEGTVARVDPASTEVDWTVEVGEGPTELVVVDGSAWVTVTDEGTLVELDIETGDVLTRTPLGGAVAGGGPTGISYGAEALWIAMQGEQSVVKVEL